MTAVHSQVQEKYAGSPDIVCPSAPSLGANWRDGLCYFTIWAPLAKRIEVQLVRDHREVELESMDQGYFRTQIHNVEPDSLYLFQPDGGIPRGDPASRFQPQGVFGPSCVLDTSCFHWTDQQWPGLELKDYVVYELHVGVYTPSGTFDALCEKIPHLKSLGVTAVELMPVAQFPGSRNWGYDGVFPFAVQNSYGGPQGLQRFVDACHRAGLAVVLDVVYNHLGPEGNFLGEFGPYFTDRYRTPWGKAINFDGSQSDHVVRYFVENALYWLEQFHIDALRLDAIHGIFDRNAQPFLSLLSAAVDDLARRCRKNLYLIAESDLNDPSFVRRRESGGYGLHAQWNDDFHHSLHAVQTGERTGYYCDFGSLSQLCTALQKGYVYSGQYSQYRKHRHGAPAANLKRSQLVVFSQNHDQVGNRGWGERSSTLIDFERQKLSAGAVLLSPFIPLLFMGEEYGETAPFLYFTDHSDPALGRAVRDGRREEFAGFHGSKEVPDPQEEITFLKSKLDHTICEKGKHKLLLEFYRALLHLRKTHAGFTDLETPAIDSFVVGDCLTLQRSDQGQEFIVVFNFGDESQKWSLPSLSGCWIKLIDSSETKWGGPGSTVPDRINEGSGLELELPPKSFSALERASTAQETPKIGRSRVGDQDYE